MLYTHIKDVVEKHFTDSCDVYRSFDAIDTDGTVNNLSSDIPTYAAVPCRMSFKSSDTAISGNAMYENEALTLVVYCSVEVDLLKGDRMVVTRDVDGSVVTYEGIVGRPDIFQ